MENEYDQTRINVSNDPVARLLHEGEFEAYQLACARAGITPDYGTLGELLEGDEDDFSSVAPAESADNGSSLIHGGYGEEGDGREDPHEHILGNVPYALARKVIRKMRGASDPFVLADTEWRPTTVKGMRRYIEGALETNPNHKSAEIIASGFRTARKSELEGIYRGIRALAGLANRR